MNNDKHMYRVYDKQKKEYLPINDFFISPEGLLCFHQGKHRGEFNKDRYIKEKSLGTRDKNNIVIFENDMVKIKSQKESEDGGISETETTGIARYNVSEGRYIHVLDFHLYKNKVEMEQDNMPRNMRLSAYRSEVIGNAHDNKIQE